MTLQETILSVVLSLPGPAELEAPHERTARLATIAEAVALEAESHPPGWRWGSRELAALVLATTYEESGRWRRDVHSGERTGDGGAARCLAQLHRHPTWAPREVWLRTTGTDLEATRVCVRGAVSVLEHYAAECVSSWLAERDIEGAFARIAAGYGSGRSCNPEPRPWARRRARLAMRLLADLTPLREAVA